MLKPSLLFLETVRDIKVQICKLQPGKDHKENNIFLAGN